MRVLIADDHPLILAGIKRALEEADGFDVVAEASSGSQVLPLVSQTNPDLALLDLRMPEMDGLTCLDRIRKQHPKVKVVILSVSTDPELPRMPWLMMAPSSRSRIEPRSMVTWPDVLSTSVLSSSMVLE